MVTRENAINEIKQFAAKCNLDGIKLNKILFFGSVAQGTATKFSDIDVMIFSDKFTDNIFENIKLYSKSIRGFHNLDVKAYNTKWYYEGDLLIDEVKKTGVELMMD